MPGLNATGCAKKRFTHDALRIDESTAPNNAGSVWCPVTIRSRSRTRIARRFAEGCAGASSGKNFSTGSSMLSFPSAAASPMAVEVKLLLSE